MPEPSPSPVAEAATGIPHVTRLPAYAVIRREEHVLAREGLVADLVARVILAAD